MELACSGFAARIHYTENGEFCLRDKRSQRLLTRAQGPLSHEEARQLLAGYRADSSYQPLTDSAFARPISKELDLGAEHVWVVPAPRNPQCFIHFRWWQWSPEKLGRARRQISSLIREVRSSEQDRRGRTGHEALKRQRERLWKIAQDLGYHPAVRTGFSINGRDIDYWIGEETIEHAECFECARIPNRLLDQLLPLIRLLRGYFRPGYACAEHTGPPSRLRLLD